MKSHHFHITVQQIVVIRTRIAIRFENEKRVLVGRVMEVLGDERLGFEELFPFLANTSESEKGFHGKA